MHTLASGMIYRNGLMKIPKRTLRSTETGLNKGRMGQGMYMMFFIAPMIQWILFSWHLPTVNFMPCRMVHDW